MAEDTNNVDTVSPEIEADEKLHAVCRDLYGGVEVMRERARSNVYMWPNPLELELVNPGAGGAQQDRATGLNISSGIQGSLSGLAGVTLYDLRVARSDLPNPWAESIEDLAAMPFRERVDLSGYDLALTGEDVVVGGEVVGRTPGWVDDFDGEGRSLDEWAQGAFLRSLLEGVVFGLVDQDARSFPSPAARLAAGARPYCRMVCRGDIRGLVVGTSAAGVPRLLYLSLVHAVKSVDLSNPNAWKEVSVPARKVYLAGDENAERGSDEARVRVYVYVMGEDVSGRPAWVEREDLRGFVVPDDPTEELRDIPFVPLYSQRIGPWRGRSPFINTAWTQVGIWNHNSEMAGLAREAAITYVHESGVKFDEGGQPVIPDTRNLRYRCSSEPTAKLSIEEVEGKAVKTIAFVIDRKEEAIRKAHHAILADRPSGPVTAREITVEAVQASSKLESWAILHEAAWTRILDLVSLLGGLERRGRATIPHDFALPSANLDALKEIFLADHMHPKNFWGEYLRAGMVDEQSFDMSLEIAMWEERRESARALEKIAAATGFAEGGDGKPREDVGDGEDGEDAPRLRAVGDKT